ncbi:actin cytoskeleton protein [Aspergillus rambellii]|uniref:Actin cytoskeleton protein n=1 Tax=Aspergillus rambellii TaxID=308745 RepID=A0A0F8XC09_9EURO|nr:actin cytoskeleton protein [Aspergillus rambellii]
MSQHTTVHVEGISPATTDKEVQDFFSFCGKITSMSVTPSSAEADAPKSASVTFEKDAAAKTALLLDQTQLAPPFATAAEAKDENNHTLEQEDKPRSRIVAEYLAHGYVISDNAIQKAITLDQKHGFSSRFTAALTNFDKKTHASDRARGLDESYQISNKAASGWQGLNNYFEKALSTPSGQKLLDFYTRTDKQVRDIHNEARRLADLKSGKPAAESGHAAPPVTEAAAAPSTEKA